LTAPIKQTLPARANCTPEQPPGKDESFCLFHSTEPSLKGGSKGAINWQLLGRTAAEPIIVTSDREMTVRGDMNADGSAMTPLAFRRAQHHVFRLEVFVPTPFRWTASNAWSGGISPRD
jgi:hypothetical protein